jgi:3-methyladenine DNA glycosylase AlkD
MTTNTQQTTPLPPPTPAPTSQPQPIEDATRAIVDDVVAWLLLQRSDANRAGMDRFGMPMAHVVGVGMPVLRAKAKALGRDHALAQALWQAGFFETRLLAAFVDEPTQVTTAQIEAWLADVDTWALCDGLCIHLLSKAPRARAWAAALVTRDETFLKRAGFALVATLAVHDDDDAWLQQALPWIARGAADERPIVRKAVSWALRGIGKRSLALHGPALALAERLATQPATSQVGKDAARELRAPAVRQRLVSRAATLAKKSKTTKTKSVAKKTKKA